MFGHDGRSCDLEIDGFFPAVHAQIPAHQGDVRQACAFLVYETLPPVAAGI